MSDAHPPRLPSLSQAQQELAAEDRIERRIFFRELAIILLVLLLVAARALLL